jgi:hypothetical protein
MLIIGTKQGDTRNEWQPTAFTYECDITINNTRTSTLLSDGMLRFDLARGHMGMTLPRAPFTALRGEGGYPRGGGVVSSKRGLPGIARGFPKRGRGTNFLCCCTSTCVQKFLKVNWY